MKKVFDVVVDVVKGVVHYVVRLVKALFGQGCH